MTINTTLYTKDSKGSTRFWTVSSDLVPDDNGCVTILLTYGVEGSDKIQTKTRLAKPKNIGKANETTGASQALKDIESLITAQKDKGYVENVEDYQEPFKPMLAHKYADRKHTIKWGDENITYYASSKLDGIRCFILVTEQGSISYLSRSGKPIKNMSHITRELITSKWYKEHLKHNNSNSTAVRYVLDGELFNNDMPFNEIASLVNRSDYDESIDHLIQFHMYDFIDLTNKEQPFPERLESFWKHSNSKTVGKSIYLVEQHPVSSEEALMALFNQHVADGYEGTMLKSNAPYVFGKRSNSLLKYKEMEFEEFEIIDIKLAENDDTKVQATLKAANGSLFDVGTIKGNREEVYQKYYVNRESLIGKWVTVQYQTLSSYGIPMFPVLIDIRDGEVIDGQFTPDI